MPITVAKACCVGDAGDTRDALDMGPDTGTTTENVEAEAIADEVDVDVVQLAVLALEYTSRSVSALCCPKNSRTSAESLTLAS